MHSRPIVFIDLETTGMSAERDRITDIGAVRVHPDGRRETAQWLVNPGMRIPPHIRALTGISDDMVAHAPPFDALAAEVCEWLGDALLVAHNATFDMGFLRASFARCGRPRALPHVCSVRVARKLIPDLRSRSLDALADHHGLAFAGRRHRALPDAELLSRLWFLWRDTHGPEKFDPVVAALAKPERAAPTAATIAPSRNPLPCPEPARRENREVPAMQSLLEILNKTRDFFTQKGLENPRLEAELLISGTLGMKRLELYLKFERPMSEPELALLRERVKRRAAREPLQYVLGETDFRELTLKCDRRALIPRPETEELVELVLKRLPADAALRVADLGTGTGAIALSLAHERPNWRVTAADFSDAALALARENAAKCKLTDRLEFLKSDWLTAVPGTFDAIVSNPPYLTDDEVAVAQPEVKSHEPHSALIAPDAGLADLEKILRQARTRLAPGGLLALETGIAHHDRLAQLARELGYSASESHKDSSDFDRFFLATL